MCTSARDYDSSELQGKRFTEVTEAEYRKQLAVGSDRKG